VLANTASVRVVSVDSPTADTLQTITDLKPDVICVFGIPPRAIRHVRMRCHQIRGRFPDAVIVACVLSKECDLSNLRSRIPTEDAQHVVCSLQLMKDYLTSLLHPAAPPGEAEPETRDQIKPAREIEEAVHEIQVLDAFDGTEEDVFHRLATGLARSFDAPIALITVANGQRQFWETQCGLPEDTLTTAKRECDPAIWAGTLSSQTSLIIPDTAEHKQFANDPFLKEKGIRFYAGAPLRSHEGEVMGSLCVLDTRPRQISEQQKDLLISTANSVMTAIELHKITPPAEEIPEPEPQPS
jgi:GAF domain-containing protein